MAENVITGKGFTVIVKVDGVPTQELASGVTVIDDVTGCVPGLFAIKVGMSVVPFPASPMAVLELVQE